MKVLVCIAYLLGLSLVQGLGLRRNSFLGDNAAPGLFQITAPKAMPDAKVPVQSWIEQKLDHLNPLETRTWQQRYYVNEQFYSPGGPIFIMVNPEGPADLNWLRGGQMMELALAYNAKTFLLEQRFYGLSRPTEDASTTNMNNYFNFKQSINDLATLAKAVRIVHPAVKVVVFGGSMAGNVATWARQEFPNVIDAAVISSAPLRAKFDFWEYMEDVALVMGNASAACVEDMKEATTTAEEILYGVNGAETIATMFSLCSPIDVTNKMDVMNFFLLFGDIYAAVVETARALTDVQEYCDLMTNPLYGSLPIDRLVEFTRSVYRPSPCLEVRYKPYVDLYVNPSWTSPGVINGRRQYLFQTCNEIGDFQSSSSPLQPFGDAFRTDQFVQICKDYYDQSFSAASVQADVDRTNAEFGGDKPQVSNVVFVHGSFDPWAILGVTTDLSVNATAIVIEGSSHISDMSTYHVTDSAALKEARLKIKSLVGQWIAA